MAAAIVLAVLACVVAYLTAPPAIGEPLFLLVTVTSLCCAIAGPVLRRAEPRRVWRFGMASGVLFLFGLALRIGLVDGLPAWLASPDLWAMFGHVALGAWLAGLLRASNNGIDHSVWLDSAIVAAGSALVCWVLAVGPQMESGIWGLETLMIGAVFPVPDVILLAMTVHLARSRTRRGPALYAVLTALACLLAGDAVYLLDMPARLRLESNPAGNALFMLAFAAMGLVTTHPSMHLLGLPPSAPERREPSDARTGLVWVRHLLVLVAMVAPTLLPVLVHDHGLLDRTVRGALVLALCVLVYLRLVKARVAAGRAEAESHFRAWHDGLTGLPNRATLLLELDQRLHRDSGGDGAGWVGLLFVDCDQFKRVNDTWGHQAGDALLLEVSGRLRRAIGPGDLLARVGGDEFVVLTDVSGTPDAVALAERIQGAFGTPMSLPGGQQVVMSASIGIAGAPFGDSCTAEELVQDADMALTEAKSRGRGCCSVLDDATRATVGDRLLLVESLRGALDRGEISAHFQPIHGGHGFEELVGWEALCRWTHPARGPVSPDVFIPIAEDSGVIVDIGGWMIRQACEWLAIWREASGRDDLHVAVNVSPVQMLRGDLPALVSQVLEESGLPADALWLEITESMMIDRSHEAMDLLGRLHDLGVTLCMDDFGTGYSSLSYLTDFPIDILKIDRAFINLIGADGEEGQPPALVKAILDMAAALGLKGVVAEGVETRHQADVLSALGCDLVQGWLFGRPLPAWQVLREDWIRPRDPAAPASIPVT